MLRALKNTDQPGNFGRFATVNGCALMIPSAGGSCRNTVPVPIISDPQPPTVRDDRRMKMGWREDEIRRAEAAYFDAQSAWESATIRMNNALAKLQTLRQNKERAADIRPAHG
jgi:hypothetical protein